MNFVHPTAQVEPGAVVGELTKIWAHAQVRDGARIGTSCVIGRNVFVDVGVRLGDCVKVQNNASLYEGVSLADGVFIGPHVIFTNDRLPRAITPDGRLKAPDDWSLGRTEVRHGAAIGAHTVIITGVTVGRWAMVGAGSVVTHDVPDHALVLGNPARIIGYVSAAGVRCATQADAVRLTLDEQRTSAMSQKEATA